ncbi:MAG: alkaline phosphatase family protein [Geminicoccaceae bacterium]
MQAFPTVRFRALPVSENLPTILTGAAPHVHGMWGPCLRSDRRPGVFQRSVDCLPDLVTTTAQCVAHAISGPIEVATMPPRRRRRFDWMRMNIKFARDKSQVVRRINKTPSIFNVLGSQGEFVYEDRHEQLDTLLDAAVADDREFRMIANHSLDYLLHWNMGDGSVGTYETKTDAFIAELETKCRQSGIDFMLLSDHGQDAVTRVVDIVKEVDTLDLDQDQVDIFVENTRATLWWQDEATGARLLEHLDQLDFVSVLLADDLARFGVHFPDGRYGQAYVFADPGCTFFPNDFFQPFANFVLSQKDPGMRTRRNRPWHVGDHGYLAETTTEYGFMTLAADGYRALSETIHLTDIAPSILTLLERQPPESMTGRAVFARRSHAPTPRSHAATPRSAEIVE